MIDSAFEPQVLSAIIRGRYRLLLGAGFSYSATDGKGQRLPIGVGLATEIQGAFGLPSEGYSLSQLASAVEPDDLKNLITNRFFKCRASTSTKLISRVTWRDIFTFNVDDVLDDCYSAEGAYQTLKPVTYKHAYCEYRDPGDLRVIYMHGYVRMPDHGFVFSLQDYGQEIADGSTWFSVLADMLATEPFIVIGTSLAEPDLEYYLARRRGLSVAAQQIAPSLYVTDRLDPVKRRLCERFGLLPVEGGGDAFFEYLRGKLPSEVLRPEQLALNHHVTFSKSVSEKDARIFLRQWLVVRPSELPEPLPGQDDLHLLKGTEPSWHQIDRNDDIIRKESQRIVSDIAAWIGEASTERKSKIEVVFSPPGEGKSCILMRAALEIAKSGIEIFYYSALERLSHKAAKTVLSQTASPVVLFVDQITDQGNQVATLAHALKTASVPYYIIGADRFSRASKVADAFSELHYNEVRVSHVGRGEALVLARKLRGEGMLGKKAGRDDQEIARLLSRDLMSGLAILSANHDSLDKFIQAELEDLSEEGRNTYGLIAIAHARGASLKMGVIDRALSIGVARLTDVMRDELRGLVRGLPPHGEYRQTRHRVIAERVSNHIEPERKFELFEKLAKSLAPYVNRQMIINGTQEAVLSGRLLDYDKSIRPELGDRADDFYRRIRNSWGWNSRYWEQIALSKIDSNLVDALRYAEHAVGVERHRVPLTTLAKVYFRLARAHSLAPESQRYLRLALDHAEQAAETAWRYRDIYPADVAIRGVIEYAEDQRGAWDVPADIQHRVSKILKENLHLFRREQQNLLQDRWRKIVQRSDS